MTSTVPSTPTVAGADVPLLLVGFGSVAIATAIIVGAVAYKIGYRRACEDMSIRKAASVIRPVDTYKRSEP